MAGKSVIWSSRANNEFREVLEFFVKRNGSNEYSLRLLEKTNEFIQILSENEFIGRLSDNKRTRVLVMDVYLIFYEINFDSIEIVSFWDNRQNPNKRIDK